MFSLTLTLTPYVFHPLAMAACLHMSIWRCRIHPRADHNSLYRRPKLSLLSTPFTRFISCVSVCVSVCLSVCLPLCSPQHVGRGACITRSVHGCVLIRRPSAALRAALRAACLLAMQVMSVATTPRDVVMNSPHVSALFSYAALQRERQQRLSSKRQHGGVDLRCV